VWGCVVGGTLVSGYNCNTTIHKKYKKYCTIHNADTVAYATQWYILGLNAKRK